ncbi:MAG TPA: hypothetical protein P5106_09295, partial [Caldisericia bacterium]|nr:hypothetical protein [Caldisericia bacterium]
LTNTMSQNLYIYCYNNPYGYKDPSGFTADLHEPIPNGTPICESGELSEQQQAMYDIAKEDNPELTIEEFLVIFSEAFNIVNKIQKYDDEMYNKYDLEIMFWTCYWNDKAKLGLTTDEKIEMANYIKAMAFIESDVGNADTTSQGFLQVTGHTWDVAKEFGYINLDDSYRENLGAKDPSMNAGIYAGIACFLMSLSKVQDDWGGGILENKNKTYSKTMKGYTPYKKLDDWIKERTNDDGSVDSIKWKDPNGGNRRILAAVADHGGSGFNTNMRNYNTKHGTNYLSGEFSHYAHGVDLLVRTGRNPKSWYGVGKNYLFVP